MVPARPDIPSLISRHRVVLPGAAPAARDFV